MGMSGEDEATMAGHLPEKAGADSNVPCHHRGV